MTPDEWRAAVGECIEAARGRRSIRSCAHAAGIDEASWRQVERGFRRAGDATIPANPLDRNLEAIAKAVGLDPAAVFAAVGRPYEAPGPPPVDRLSAVESRLDRIEEQIAELLDREDP